MRRYKGTLHVFFGKEHRLRKEEMEEQFDREAKEGWRFAASAARITEEMVGGEDRKHSSGGVFVDSNLGAVVGAEEGAMKEESPRLGCTSEVDCVSSQSTSAIRGMVVKK